MKEIVAEGNSMPASNHDVSFHVLLACANKGPEGFFPRVDGDGVDLDRAQIDTALDMLRLGGFIEIADWNAQKGQGYRATEAGKQAAVRPELLRRPAAVKEPNDIDRSIRRTAWDEAEEIRRAVLTPPTAIVTPILIAINVIVYLWQGYFSLQHGKTIPEIMNGSLAFPMPGALMPLLFFDGDWWLLFTYMFLHGSPMHIFLNMFCLFSLGNVMEGRWGWPRFLVLYFGSGLIGGVAVLLARGNPLLSTLGASGAISGLLTSLAVWAWMHRRYLPPQFVEAHFRVVGINLLILIGSGFMPGISMSAHVGGAVGGALLSVPLAWLSPYSPGRHRIIGAICLLLIASLSLLALQMTPHPDIPFQQIIIQQLRQ